ncbi:MAG TPA: PEP-CTERM sorting domain-containing protein [Candidatus Sulfotelmatobacter sp.]
MRRILFVALLALALPMAAFANSTSTDFVAISGPGSLVGIGGTGSTFGGSSTIIGALGYDGRGIITGADMGTLSFTTGGLLSHSGNLFTYAGGGTFTISGSGAGLPSGVLFSGTFSGKVTVEMFSNGGYGLVCEPLEFGGCSVNGTWSNGQKASGGFALSSDSSGLFAYVNLQTPVVPEPGTLSLLGTGLLGLGMVVRRKLRV